MEIEPEVLRVGDCYPALAIQKDGCVFLWNNGVPIINVLIYKPDQYIQDLADIDVHGLSLGAYSYRNVLFLAVKPGLLPWDLAVYNPYADEVEECTLLWGLPEGGRLPAIYLLTDSSNGRILKIHMFLLGEELSSHIVEEVLRLWQEGKETFDLQEFYRTASLVVSRFSAEYIGKEMKRASFSLPANGGKTEE